MVVTFLTFLSIAWSPFKIVHSKCNETSDTCLLLNGVAVISATQTENGLVSNTSNKMLQLTP